MIGRCAHGAHEMLRCVYFFLCARNGPAKVNGRCAHGTHELLHCIYVFICARSGPPKVGGRCAHVTHEVLHCMYFSDDNGCARRGRTRRPPALCSRAIRIVAQNIWKKCTWRFQRPGGQWCAYDPMTLSKR